MGDPAAVAGTPAGATDARGCAAMFAEFARSASLRAPLYHALAAGIARDLELAALLMQAPPRQRQPVLMFASIHFLLLLGRDDVGLACPLPEPHVHTGDDRSAARAAPLLHPPPCGADGPAGDA